MKTIKMSEASRPLAEYAAALRDEIVVLTERNRPVAAIVPLRKTDRESLALSAHPGFLNVIERSRADFRGGRTISLEAMKNKLKSQLSNRRLEPAKTRRRAVKKQRGRARLRG